MPVQADWTDEPVLTRSEAIKIIQFPRWLFDYARNLFAETDDPETAFLRLPHMTDTQARKAVQEKLKNMPKDYCYEEINSLFPKLYESHLLIEKALLNLQNMSFALSCSWGKDSVAVLHLLLQHVDSSSFHVLFNNTGVEWPETIKLARRLEKKWTLNIVEAQPQEMNFWDIVNQYGWPQKGRYKGKKGGDRASSECCKHLKKKPTKKKIHEYGWKLIFTGITRHESDVRQLAANRYGNYFYSKTWGLIRCHPILEWTDHEVLYYTKYHHLPVNEIYRPIPPDVDTEKFIAERDTFKIENEFDFEDQVFLNKKVPSYKARTGCAFCQIGGNGKRRYLRLFKPKMFNLIIHKKGLGKVLINQKWEKKHGKQPQLPGLEAPSPDEALANKPCYFEKI